MNSFSVAVVGAGYVGVASAVAFALGGHRVHLVERDPARVAHLRAGRAPFDEPQLEAALALCSERLTVGDDLGAAVRASSVIVLAVGTPPTPAQGADLSQLFTVAEALAPHLDEVESARVIAVKSTVPVGTCAQLEASLRALNPGARFAVTSNPEFLRQGRALTDAIFPDRIVVGAREAWAAEVMRQLYAPICCGAVTVPEALELHRRAAPPPLLELSPESAELAKYAANAFLAMKISFINEIANVCEATGADVDDIVRVLGSDPRIGGDFLRPGLGYGGSCFPKDTRALSQFAARSGYEFRLLRSVIEVNAVQRFRALDRLERQLGGLRGRVVTVLGLTFKPGTDDLRESIGVDLALELRARGAAVRAHDPVAARAAESQLAAHGIETSADLEASLDGADAALLVTEWDDYARADWRALGKLMRQRIVLDGRNALDPDTLRAADFAYLGVGRV